MERLRGSLARAGDGALTDLHGATRRGVLELDDADGAVDIDLGDAEIRDEGAAVADGQRPTRTNAIAGTRVDLGERRGAFAADIDDRG